MNRNIEKLDLIKTYTASAVKEASSGCPCELVEPCSDRCSCADNLKSGGCMRCCKYGSLEQRRHAAKRLADTLSKPEEEA